MPRSPCLHLCSVTNRLRRLAIPHMDTAFSSGFSRSHFHCVCCHLTAGGLMDSFTLWWSHSWKATSNEDEEGQSWQNWWEVKIRKKVKVGGALQEQRSRRRNAKGNKVMLDSDERRCEEKSAEEITMRTGEEISQGENESYDEGRSQRCLWQIPRHLEKK